MSLELARKEIPLTRELTPEELDEISSRLRAGDISVVKMAVAAVKPRRAQKPKRPQPTIEEKRIAGMMTKAGELLELQRTLYEADQTVRAQKLHPNADAWQTITGGQWKVREIAYSLAHSILCHFKAFENTNDSIPR